jgi:hypothetical protein
MSEGIQGRVVLVAGGGTGFGAAPEKARRGRLGPNRRPRLREQPADVGTDEIVPRPTAQVF